MSKRPIRRALVSVYDKSGLDELGAALAAAGVQVVSTGSTAARLKDAGVPVTLVEELTGGSGLDIPAGCVLAIVAADWPVRLTANQVPIRTPGDYVPSGLRFNGAVPGSFTDKVEEGVPFAGSWGKLSWQVEDGWTPGSTVRIR